jgi:hypothetical protein
MELRRESKAGMKTALRMELLRMQLDQRAFRAPREEKEHTRVCAWRAAAREPLVGVLRTRCLVKVTPGWMLGSVAEMILEKETARRPRGCA